MKQFLILGTIILTAIFAIAANPIKVNCVKISGAIEKFSDTEITVNGKTYVIHKDTEFENGSKADMAVGVYVTVEGEYRNGILYADEIEFKETAGGKNKITKVGKISSVSGDAFTVSGVTFTVESSTEFENGTRADLSPGRFVKVEGYKEENGTIVARCVLFKDDDSGEDDEVEVKGLVTAVGDGTFTVGGMVFVITPGTKFIGMSLGGLVVGILVEVEAEKKGTGRYDAITIKLKKDTNDDPEARMKTGVLVSVQSLGDELLELTLADGTTFYVDEDTRLSGRHGLKCFAEDLVPGLTVCLKYKMSSSESEGQRREVTHVSVIGNAEIKGLVSGATVASIDGSLLVGNTTVHYDSRTIVQGDTKAKEPSEIPNGKFVVALSNPLEDGSFLANRIVVTNNDDDDDLLGRKLKFYGTVSALAISSSLKGFSVGDQMFDVDGNTDFRVIGSNEPFDPLLLEEGMSVKVLAVYEGSGEYVAAKVCVYLPIFRFTGPLEAISAKALSMLGIDISITKYTKYKDVKAGELGVSSVVEVKAVLWPDDTLIACEIKPADDDDKKFEAKGVISKKAADGKNLLITVGGLTIVVRPNGTSISTNNSTPTFDDLAVGVYVQVSGFISDTGTYIARHIKIH